MTTTAAIRNRQTRADRIRVARSKGRHTPEEWQRLKTACGNRCVRCLSDRCNLERDHIRPVYQGGSDGIENIQPLCARCNASKGPEAIDHRPSNWCSKMGGAA